MRPPYFAYLEQSLQRHDPTSPLWQGYAYRCIRDLVNLGRAAEAGAKAEALLAALAATYGPDIADPVAMEARIRGCEMLVEFGRVAPYFLPSLYFALGGIAQHRGDLPAARRFYQGARDIAVECGRFGAIFFLEAGSLVWPARINDANLALAQGDLADAAAAYARLAREGRRCDAAGGFARASREYIEGTVPRGCEALALRGAWGQAREVFAAYRDYLAATFPAADPTARATLEAALDAGGAEERPLDPVFPFLFQGILDAAAPDGAPAAHDRLHALCELAATHRQHPVYGAGLTAGAEIARRCLPLPRSVPLFDFSFDLGAPGPRKR
jgi:hypothetical protein